MRGGRQRSAGVSSTGAAGLVRWPSLRPRLAARRLLGATVLGTISNNIINVPLRRIIGDFGAPVTRAS